MIDWDYESRLVNRIAAREVIAATTLTRQQRQVILDWARSNDTQAAIGERAGVSGARVCQIITQSLRRLNARAKAEPLSGFNRAEFLRHMQGLIAKREIQARQEREREEQEAAIIAEFKEKSEALREREVFDRERKSLDEIMRTEEAAGLFDPPAPPKPKFVLPAPPRPPARQLGGTIYWPSEPTQQNVEAWLDLARTPTVGDMYCVAQYALGYFVSARRPEQPGSGEVGKMTTRVVCPRTADGIAAAMQAVKNAIPAQAQLSACLLDVPENLMAVVRTCLFVALRVASIEDGKKVSIEVTWDD